MIEPDDRRDARAPSGAREADRSRHWEYVAGDWGRSHPHELWRSYCDIAYSNLVDRWLPRDRVERLLKTDLFDEVVTDGLYPALARHADDVVGIDLATSAATQARARHPRLGTLAADARQLPFADESFDAIVSNSTLDHFSTLDDVAISLAELRRVTRRGGTLILTLDNLSNPVVRLRGVLPADAMRRLGLVPYFVGATCGPARLRELVAQAGYRVEAVEGMMHCPRVLAVAVARIVQRFGSAAARRLYMRHVASYERLDGWPTRSLTSYYTAIRAVRATD